MRKVIISLAAAASVLAVPTPAATQYHSGQYHAGQYHQARPVYGYNYQSVRALQTRVNRIQQNLQRLAQYRVISRNEYNNRQQDARQIERKLARDFRDGRGLNAREFAQTEQRIDRLERNIGRDMRDGRRYAYGW
jgi:hypothetical protein